MLNQLTTFLRGAFALLAVAFSIGFAPAAWSEPKTLTVDDLMRVESFGSAAISPDGRWLIFERLRPYEEYGDFSFRTYAFQKSGHQLWRYDIKNGGTPELLPGLDPAPHSYIESYSPTGRYLTIMQYRFGKLTLIVYDTLTEETKRVSNPPAFDRAGNHNPIWISDSEIAFSALPNSEYPSLTSVRAGTGTKLFEYWQQAWRGTAVTATEVRTMPSNTENWQQEGALILFDAASGTERIIAEGLFADLRTAPSGKYLAALSVSKPTVLASDGLLEGDRKNYKLNLINVESGSVTELAADLEFFPYTLEWSSDSGRIAAFGWPPMLDPKHGRFYVVDILKGTRVKYEHKCLSLVSERERGWLQRPERTAFFGDELVVFARASKPENSCDPKFEYQDMFPDNLSKADWYALSPDGSSRNLTNEFSDVSGVPVSASNRQLTFSAAEGVFRVYDDGSYKRLSPDFEGTFRLAPAGTFSTRGSVIRPAYDDSALFVIRGVASTSIAAIDLRPGKEGAATVATVEGTRVAAIVGSAPTQAVLYQNEQDAATNLWLYNNSDTEQPRLLATVNSHLSGIEYGTWEVYRYEYEDPERIGSKRIIENCVLLPPGYSYERPLPLIVEVYPNAGPRCKSSENIRIEYPKPLSEYLWPARGYAYARLSLPRDLIRTEEGPIAGMDDLVNASVKSLIAENIADPDRIALYGFSQGGVSALYVAAHSKQFKAVIAINSWADFVSHYFGGTGVFSSVYGQYFGAFSRYESLKGSDFGIGVTPFDDPQAYYRNSPILLAPAITAPVLLMHSDMDAFPSFQFDEMYAALFRAGKDARYVRYWGEGHGPSSPQNIRDMWHRMDQFLEDKGIAPS